MLCDKCPVGAGAVFFGRGYASGNYEMSVRDARVICMSLRAGEMVLPSHERRGRLSICPPFPVGKFLQASIWRKKSAHPA